jgi:nucleoside-diphosphate-sugar epimerase
MNKVMVTDDASFIGRHVATALQDSDHCVQWLDNLDPLIYGPEESENAMYDCDAGDFLIGDQRFQSE